MCIRDRINTDGDSSGVIVQSQQYYYNQDTGQSKEEYYRDNPSNYSIKVVKSTFIELKGTYTFDWKVDFPGNSSGLTKLDVFFHRSNGTDYFVALDFPVTADDGQPAKTYSIPIDMSLTLFAGESLVLTFVGKSGILYFNVNPYIHDYYFIPRVSNILYSVDSQSYTSIVYGRYGLDVLKEIVSKATGGQFTVNSNFYSTNKNIVLTCGNALRNAPNA